MRLNVPGSKSITNRALVCAALAGKSVIKNFVKCDDTAVMIKALKKLGVSIKLNGNSIFIKGKPSEPKQNIYCGNSGTTMRFLTAVLAAMPFESMLNGNKRMRQRPIKDLSDALQELGAKTEFIDKNGFPPIKVKGPLNGAICRINGKISSQFLSGLLLAAPLSAKNVTIKVKGNLVSRPYIDLTLNVMKSFGIQIERSGYKKITVASGQIYRPTRYEIEGDVSSASYFWAISAISGAAITITNVPENSLQADVRCLDIVKKYFSGGKRNISVENNLPSLKIDCRDFPDSAMTLAIICAFSHGKFLLSGLENLRVKECDRLKALSTELNKIGCKTKELKNGLLIKGNPENLHPSRIKTYADHRIAMCFGVAGLFIPGIKILNPGCVTKTYPNFWRDLKKAKAYLCEKNVILTGMRGSGKTKLGRLLAKRMDRTFIDTDAMIESISRQKIPRIVAKKGWRYFRTLEKRVIRKLKNVRQAVIATGGGAMMIPSNTGILKKGGRVVYLDCPPKILKERIIDSKNRPALMQGRGQKSFLNELDSICKQRKKSYLDCSDFVLDARKNSKNKKKDINDKIDRLLKITARWGMN